MINQYILHMTVAAIFAVVTLHLIPKGPIREFGSFIGMLLVVLAVISPIAKLELHGIEDVFRSMESQVVNTNTSVERSNRDLLGQLIKEQCETYILDKAAAMKLELSVEVTLDASATYPTPSSVRLTGVYSEESRRELGEFIEDKLGIAFADQEWKHDQ